MNIRALASWLSSSKRTKPVTTICLHATAGSSLSGALSALRSRNLSYHYLIAKDGAITKAVPTSRTAWHAGQSFGPQGSGVNSYSIGISLVNLNNGIDPYPQAQREALSLLCTAILDVEPTVKYLTTHWAVSPGRKSDPKKYPLEELYAELRKAHPRLILWVGSEPK